MQFPRSVHVGFGILAWLAVAGILAAGLLAGPAYSFDALYVGVIALAIWAPNPRHAYYLAAASTAALAMMTWRHGDSLPAALGHIVAILVLWVAAVVVARYRIAHDRQETDVSARAEAETALRRSIKDLEDMRYALDQSAIVATTDVTGAITYANDQFCQISRYSREELLGQNHRIVNSGFHPVEFFQEMYRTIGSGRVWHGEIRNRAKDGTLYWVDTTIVPFMNEAGKPYQYVAVRYDITERKRSEAALREQAALAQLGKMAAVVAHEVRNPLAGIKGAMQVIAPRLAPGSSEHGIVREVISRIDTLNDIVQDLLQFARPRRPELASVHVGALVQETISLLREDPKFAAVEVQVEARDAILAADPDQLKLVLSNLLINSAQAMKGSGAIRVVARQVDGWHELRVADQGPGIPTDVREHLFEPFFTTKHRGTGLGLATARRILDAHHGSIELTCPPDGGTVAIVRLPAETASPRPRPRESPREAETR